VGESEDFEATEESEDLEDTENLEDSGPGGYRPDGGQGGSRRVRHTRPFGGTSASSSSGDCSPHRTSDGEDNSNGQEAGYVRTRRIDQATLYRSYTNTWIPTLAKRH
jgi:hypothetical protein